MEAKPILRDAYYNKTRGSRVITIPICEEFEGDYVELLPFGSECDERCIRKIFVSKQTRQKSITIPKNYCSGVNKFLLFRVPSNRFIKSYLKEVNNE